MKTFRTIIIDDERLAREELKSLLKDYHEIEIIDEAKNGEEGIQKIKEFLILKIKKNINFII